MKLVFSHFAKGIRINITAEFRALRRLHFEDTKTIMSAEMRLKSLRTLEKRAPELLGPVDLREINRL